MKFRPAKGMRPYSFLILTAALFIAPATLTAQDKVNIPGPPSPGPLPIKIPEPGPASASRIRSSAPVASITRPSSSLEALQKDVEQLRNNNYELQRALTANTPIDVTKVQKYAENVYEIATRLQGNLWLSPAEGANTSQETSQTAGRDSLEVLAAALNESVQAFVNSPVARKPHTVDAQLLEEAGKDLDRIIDLSAGIGKQVRNLDNANSTGKPTSRRIFGSAPGRAPYLQLTLDCSAWTVDRFANLPKKSRSLGLMNVEGIKIQIKHHKLLNELLIFLDECETPQAKRQTNTNHERYAAVIKDFDSHELKERIFAYQANYQIVRIEKGRISAHLAQIVSLYYLDEGGGGVFDVYEGSRFLPDWVKGLVTPRK